MLSYSSLCSTGPACWQMSTSHHTARQLTLYLTSLETVWLAATAKHQKEAQTPASASKELHGTCHQTPSHCQLWHVHPLKVPVHHSPLSCSSCFPVCLSVPLQDCLSLFDSPSPHSPNKSLAQEKKKRTLCHFSLFLSMSRNGNFLGLNLKTSLRFYKSIFKNFLVLLSNISPSSHQHYCSNVICRRALPTHRTNSFLAPCCPPAKTLLWEKQPPIYFQSAPGPNVCRKHAFLYTCIQTHV